MMTKGSRELLDKAYTLALDESHREVAYSQDQLKMANAVIAKLEKKLLDIAELLEGACGIADLLEGACGG